MIRHNLPDKKVKEIIIQQVCEYHNLTFNTLKKKCRRTMYKEPRQLIYVFMRLFSGMSLRSIGDTFKQDHATVLHAINTINGLKEFDKDMMHKYETIEKMIVNAIVARMNYDKDELNVKQFTDMLTTLVENLPVKLLQYGVLFNPKLQVCFTDGKNFIIEQDKTVIPKNYKLCLIIT